MRENWVEFKLGEVCSFVGGGTPSKKESAYWGGEIPWASIKDIKGQYLTQTQDSISQLGLENSAANLAEPDEIIIATRINPGRPIYCKIQTAINQDLKVVKPKIKINTSYLYYSLKSLEKDIIKISSGTTVLGVNLNNLNEVSFYFPPVPEQRLIVAKIEQLFSELGNGIANFRTAQNKLEIYRQAVLKKAFKGELTKVWREQQIRLPSPNELLEKIKLKRQQYFVQQLANWKKALIEWEAGEAKKRKPVKPKELNQSIDSLIQSVEVPYIPKEWVWVGFNETIMSIRGGTTIPPSDDKTDYPILRSSSVRSTSINYFDIRFLKPELLKSDFDFIKTNDLLFTRLNGTISYVGNCARVSKQFPANCMYPDRLYCAKLVNPEQSKFFELFFSSRFPRKLIEKKAKSTAGHKRISIGDILEVPVPLCSVEEQNQMVQEIESRLSVCDKLSETIKEQLEKAEALRQSILKKAFEGRLLSDAEIEACKQEPDWEPAEQLLARIKAEREQAQAATKKAKPPRKATKKKQAS